MLSDRNGAACIVWRAGAPLDLPFPSSVKTGTSKGFRDNWTVGYTPEVTVAVWVGNFDGSPMHGVSGVTGAGPLFHDVMLAASRAYRSTSSAPEPELDAVEICPLSGALPARACPHRHRESFVRGTAPQATCSMHEMVHVDTRNGLRAGAGCPAKFVEDRSYEAFDAIYASWAKASVRSLAPDGFSPLCPRRAAVDDRVAARTDVPARGATRLTYPLDGATFIYDDGASSHQMVTLHAEAPGAATRVQFFVDGRLLTSAKAPFLADWPLARGTHRVRALPDVGQPSEPIEVTVR